MSQPEHLRRGEPKDGYFHATDEQIATSTKLDRIAAAEMAADAREQLTDEVPC